MAEHDPMTPKPAKIRHRSLKVLKLLSVLRGKSMLDVLDEIVLEAGQKAGMHLSQEMREQLDGLAQAVAERDRGAVPIAPPRHPAPEQDKRKRGRPRKYGQPE